jgi:hypothetical protein
MPEKKPRLVTFNPEAIEFLRNRVKEFRSKIGLDIESVPQKSEPKDSIIKQIPVEQKPTMPKNSYGRTYFGHTVFNP